MLPGQHWSPPPEPRSDHVVKANTWDVRAYKSVRLQRVIDSLVEELDVMHDVPKAPALVQDLFMLGYKGYPQVRPKSELTRDVKVNKQIVDVVSELPDLKVVQQFSGGDLGMSLMAVEALTPPVLDMLKQQEKEQEQQRQQQEQQQQEQQDPGQQDPGQQEGQEPGQEPGEPSDQQGDGQPSERGEDGQPSESPGKPDETQDPDDWDDEPDTLDPAAVEVAVAKGLEDAKDVVAELYDAESSAGSEPGDWENVDPQERFAYLKRLTSMKDKIDLVGRMCRFALGAYASRITPSEQEMFNVEVGGSLTRILPSQFALLAVPGLKAEFYRKYNQKELLQWKMRGREKAGKGPVVALVDKSLSMKQSNRIAWATAVAVAIQRIAAKDGRDVYVQFFDSSLSQAFHWPKGKADPNEILDALSVVPSGGTSFTRPLDRAAEIIETAADFAKADIVMITDDQARVDEAWLGAFLDKKQRLETRVWGIYIGGVINPSGSLARISDYTFGVNELTIDATERMFKEF